MHLFILSSPHLRPLREGTDAEVEADGARTASFRISIKVCNV